MDGAFLSVLKNAISLHREGRLDEAAELYRNIIAQDSNNLDALHLLATIEIQRKNPSAAIESVDRAIELNPENAVFFSTHGFALSELERFDEALASFDRALSLKPNFAEAFFYRGNVLKGMERFDEALASYENALAIRPTDIEAINNCGVVLKQLERLDEALASYDRALAFKPNFVKALYNRGILLKDLKRFDEALASLDRALARDPEHTKALCNRGIMLKELTQFDEVLASFDRALSLNSDYKFLLSQRLHCKMFICDWRGLSDDFENLGNEFRAGEGLAAPVLALATPLSAAQQRCCTETYIREEHPENAALPSFKSPNEHDKIRLGYFSADFHNHPVAHLTAELFERHDRAQFEIIAFSLGPKIEDAMRTRLEKIFDRFIEIDTTTDKDAALLARSLGIDIAIDLGGFTRGNRTGIFAMRAGPIQVNYLGYPGTMGADYIDYLIADSTLIPPEHQQHYAEKIVYLPNTFMANDSQRAIVDNSPTRADCGLPEEGFVFCCFNNSYKILPELFDIWMRLLEKAPSSVLWLREHNQPAMRNLKLEAESRGVNPDRLVFAPSIAKMEDHLARQSLLIFFSIHFPIMLTQPPAMHFGPVCRF